MKALAFIRTAERFAAVAIFLAMVALYFANVLARQVGGTFASDFAWIEEAVRLMSLFLVFLTVGLALEKGRHAGVHTWRERIARATGLPLRRIIDAVGVVFCLYLVWLGYRMTAFVHGMGQRSPTLDIPVFWIYLAPTIGFALMALRYALSLFGCIDRFAGQATEEQ
ncbi:TRAP transporter small permease [Nitratireductor sp. ZSWI3]|uniref:TRAP transporter small permease n=1 Tax=Nitratireductor sp. ZSWI3 TaxID=2966359 RepID=UPI00214F89A6|nr:TRAP transporter small permease [Nitratireductor sp. ZSWI3]MCR4268450.1 TRAP transporter small permease [Nitratireductor sp. ZSWI3]